MSKLLWGKLYTQKKRKRRNRRKRSREKTMGQWGHNLAVSFEAAWFAVM